MHIQFQAITAEGGRFTSSDFEDQKKFLKSLGTNSDFTVYETVSKKETQDKISIKSVLKRLNIYTVKPLKDKNSTYLEFTAKEKDTENIYEGLINWD